jgi:hypothetical protein
MKYLFGVFLLFMLTNVAAQSFQGRIVDAVTGNGIPFASVGIQGTNTASVSNENGDFILKITSFPAKLRISHVSYLQMEIDLNENRDKLIIPLKPASITLDEVKIDPFKAQRIVKSALEKAKVAESLNFYVNAFYRQLTTVNNRPSQIYELFYDLKWNAKRVQGWIAQKSRYAQSTEGTNFSLENLSYLTFLNSGYLLPEKGSNFVNLGSLFDYQISIEKYIEQADQQIAVISCKFKKVKKGRYYVNTTYYIGIEDSNIYRVENSLFNLPMKFEGSSLTYPAIVSTIATFNSKDKLLPVLESVATKMFLKLNAGGQQMDANISSLLLAYYIREKTEEQQYQTLDRNTKDRKVIESIKYDAEFWKHNPIVKQTALEDSFIKMMENKDAFGTMTNP